MKPASRMRRSSVSADSTAGHRPSPIALLRSDPEFLANLGERVREIREQRGVARKLLAQSADVSERYLAALEGGEGNASVILLRRVAGALGVALVELLDMGETGNERRQLRRFVESLPPKRAEEALRRLIEEFGHDAAVRRKRITLIGLRGAGKSTLGAALAKELRRPFVELDRQIETEACMQLSEVFLLYGQAGFRRIERRCLERIIASQEDIVLTVGGGIVSEPETYKLLLLNCFTVWIKATPEEHMSRVIEQGDMRPMTGHAEAMEDLRNILAAREALYAKADTVVDTSGTTVEKSLKTLRQVVQAG
jgi:XRE family transcriptional regulator, aerobic/anaerobic benzoate catabolism transcriptional regulator